MLMPYPVIRRFPSTADVSGCESHSQTCGESKLDDSTGSFLLELRESCRRGDEKTVGVRGEGGHRRTWFTE